ncbi:MAG: hypothetical protein IK144_11715 [Bacteroidaceae bacterium]|nr:hypothetical protein [Bacteroidaceae bacterium]
MEDKKFYKVLSTIDRAPLRDHLLHGYEERHDFYLAVRKLAERWHDRIGERIDERHGHLLLRFHDTPGGVPDEAWIPTYLLDPADTPEYLLKMDSSDGTEDELSKVFGFD